MKCPRGEHPLPKSVYCSDQLPCPTNSYCVDLSVSAGYCCGKSISIVVSLGCKLLVSSSGC